MLNFKCRTNVGSRYVSSRSYMLIQPLANIHKVFRVLYLNLYPSLERFNVILHLCLHLLKEYDCVLRMGLNNLEVVL